MKRHVIAALVGPTASGKSALALNVARLLDAEIVSVDSMQVYRGMDAGTAKPTPAERALVRHHMIDVVGPGDEFSDDFAPIETLPDDCLLKPYPVETPWKNGLPASALQTSSVPFDEIKKAA